MAISIQSGIFSQYTARRFYRCLQGLSTKKENACLMYRLSRRQTFGVWVAIVLISSGIVVGDCVLLAGCSFSLLFSTLSAILTLCGTLALAIPSIMLKLGESAEIERAKETSEVVKSAYSSLDNGEDLEEGTEEFEAMRSYLQEYSEFEGDASVISVEGGGSRGRVVVDGESVGVSMFSIPLRMRTYMSNVKSAEGWEEDRQERLYVLLGSGIYGLAIMFQALSSIVPNLDLITL